MGERRRQVEEERPLGMGAEEMHRLVTDPVDGVGRAAEAGEVGGGRGGLGRKRRRHRDRRIVEWHLRGIVPQNRGIERVRVTLAVVAEETIEARGEGIRRAPRRPEPPLPEAAGGIAGSVEDPRQGDGPCRHRSLPLRLDLAVAPNWGMTGMEPCHEHAAAGGTDGAAGPVPGEPRAARKQAVDIRRQGMGRPQGRHIPRAEIIGEEEDDVRGAGRADRRRTRGDGGRERIVGLMHPLRHPRPEHRQSRRVVGLRGEIADLLGIVPQVEKLLASDLRIADQLPVGGDQRALEVTVGEEEIVADRRLLPAEHRHETHRLAPRRARHAGKASDGGDEILEMAQRPLAPPRRYPGTGQDRRSAHRVLVEILLAEEAVAAECQALIAHEEDERVFKPAPRPERFHDPPHLGIERFDAGVGIGKLVRHAFAGERPGEEQLVADSQFPVVERMFGEPVCRRRRLMPPVSGPEDFRRLTRIVRHRERHPGEEGRVADPGEELHRRVTEQPRGMDPGGNGRRRHLPAVISGGKRRHGNIPLVGHPAEEHVPPRVEAAHRGSLAVVPLAGEECPPAGAPENLRPGVLTGELFVAMKETPAREHHGPAGDADGAVLPPHAVGPVE